MITSLPEVAVNWKTSAPSPPVRVSLPAPPKIELLPAPPSMVSSPFEPHKVSLPAPPLIVTPVASTKLVLVRSTMSLPSPALIVSKSMTLAIESPCEVEESVKELKEKVIETGAKPGKMNKGELIEYLQTNN